MGKETEEPNDLGVKIGTPEEAYWTKLLEETEKLIISERASLEINEFIKKLAVKKIAEETVKS